MKQTTIRNPVGFSHRGLLGGKTTSVRLRPGPPDSGIVFDGDLPAHSEYAFVERHCVGLRKADTAVIGVEHLLAACWGMGVDNLQIEVNGGEIPFGDGSALPFVRIIRAAGLEQQSAERQVQTINRPVVAWAGDSFVCVLPVEEGGTPGVNCTLSFPDAAIGEQSFQATLQPELFITEISPARTFGYWPENVPLPSWLTRSTRRVGGLVLPASPRFDNEPARHKMLDLTGDLCLLGRRLHARIFAYKSGHQLHHDLLRKLEEEWT